ncbi:MAG TPA: Rieske 2Fe-2S domain-containing protein [Gemmatimonadaceae bacterium]|nr:Rieske 2Fe-2S domain-containing protein [Gemmatimonadaceae bacterium]
MSLPLQDLEPGVPLGIVLDDGRAVCLLRIGDQVYALADQCSHQAMPLSAGYSVSSNESGQAAEIECAWHGARFRCATGEPTRGPALDAVPTYEVSIENGRVIVGPRKKAVG